jgi:hypothetical protein
MVKVLKCVLVSAMFILPLAYTHSAFSRNWSLSYQEATWMCSTGDLQACDVMYRFELARSAVSHGSPAEQDTVSESVRIGGASAPLHPVQSTNEGRSHNSTLPHRRISRAGLLWHRRKVVH